MAMFACLRVSTQVWAVQQSMEKYYTSPTGPNSSSNHVKKTGNRANVWMKPGNHYAANCSLLSEKKTILLTSLAYSQRWKTTTDKV